MPIKDPVAYKEYMREYMRKNYSKNKKIKTIKDKKMKDDFNVTETIMSNEGKETLDLKGKTTTALLEVAKKASKDVDTDQEDPVFKTVEKLMKYAPIITELFKGFSAAARNFKATQRPPPQQQRNLMNPPDGWETMTSLQKMGRKYSRPEWYAAGEKYDNWKSTGGATITPINNNYVDPTYNQPVVHQEARTLAELSRKHPEPKQVSNATPVKELEQDVPEFVNQRVKTPEKEFDNKEKELINAMREDNNKYINMAFDYIKGMSIKNFGESVNNIESFKPKFSMVKMLLPVQTKEMLKATPSDELIQTLKEKCPEHHKWLLDNKKIEEMKKLFEEIKEGIK